MNDRFVHTVWCDDIRHEIGNKPSFMGIYTGGLVVPKLPTVLPRLCLWITVNASLKKPIKRLSVQVKRDDGFLLIEAPDADLPVFTDDQELPLNRVRQVMMFAFVLSGVEVPAGCKYFQVRVKTEEEELGGSKLWVEANPEYLAQMNPNAVRPSSEQKEHLEALSPSATVTHKRARAAVKKAT